MKQLLLLTALLFLLTAPTLSQTALYKDKNQPISVRVQDLLARMTLEEKVAQTLCVWQDKNKLLLDAAGNFNPEKMAANLPNSVGYPG